MKLKHYQDKKGLIMRSRGNCVDSTQVMEKAFRNIMDEIIEHAIEGICFEAHRAARFDYFAINEYILRNLEFKICDGEEMSDPDGDIFGNDENNLQLLATCHFCKQRKIADNLGRHVSSCRSKPNGSLNWDIQENCVNTVEEEDNSDGNDNFDRKKGSDSRKQARSVKKYDTMTAAEKHDFLKKYCGVISMHTGKPCCNSLSCNKHSEEKKDNVRRFMYENSDQFLDGNIDVDTVD